MELGSTSLGSVELGGVLGSTVTPPVPRGSLAVATVTIKMHQCAVTNIISDIGQSQNMAVPYGR